MSFPKFIPGEDSATWHQHWQREGGRKYQNQAGFLGAIEHNTTALGWCVEQPMSLQAGHFQLGICSEEDEVILTGYTSFVHETFYIIVHSDEPLQNLLAENIQWLTNTLVNQSEHSTS